jgi:hypothetical protein
MLSPEIMFMLPGTCGSIVPYPYTGVHLGRTISTQIVDKSEGRRDRKRDGLFGL